MLLVAFNVAPGVEQEYEAWTDHEHLPRLSRVPGVMSARRFRAVSSTHEYVTLYHLVAPEAYARRHGSRRARRRGRTASGRSPAIACTSSSAPTGAGDVVRCDRWDSEKEETERCRPGSGLKTRSP
ncbi:MAG: hypothetical protein HYY78_08470 [Betaproteobacteria bacterium]|nr:hypothetical protein [Betaproteobacteria bacterium]